MAIMSTFWLACVTFGLVLVPRTGGAASPGSLSIALCTPVDSACNLASDGNSSSCFVASLLQENFYFAVFNTVGQPVTVSELKLLVGGSGRTNYTVSLASEAHAHDLRCTDSRDGSEAKSTATPRLLDCLTADGGSDGLANVSSLMIRPETLPIRLHLLEVIAYTEQRAPLGFAYCSAEEPGVCGRAIDGGVSLDSPAVVSDQVAFPYWLGGFNVSNTEPAASVRIYRPDNGGATFFRVNAGVDCTKTGESTNGGVEAIDYACPRVAAASPLLQVWEIDADFLVNLCEIQVFGRDQ